MQLKTDVWKSLKMQLRFNVGWNTQHAFIAFVADTLITVCLMGNNMLLKSEPVKLENIASNKLKISVIAQGENTGHQAGGVKT